MEGLSLEVIEEGGKKVVCADLVDLNYVLSGDTYNIGDFDDLAQESEVVQALCDTIKLDESAKPQQNAKLRVSMLTTIRDDEVKDLREDYTLTIYTAYKVNECGYYGDIGAWVYLKLTDFQSQPIGDGYWKTSLDFEIEDTMVERRSYVADGPEDYGLDDPTYF